MKSLRLKLPAGRAVFPHLDVPDDKFGKPQYKVSVRYDDQTLEEVRKTLTAAAKTLMGSKFNSKKPPKLPIKEKVNRDGEVEFLVEAKSNADHKPALFDAKLHKLPGSVSVGGGSLIKLDVSPFYYDAFGGGISLRLYGVQVIELAGQSRSVFEPEDGFEIEPASELDTDAATADTEAVAEGDALSF